MLNELWLGAFLFLSSFLQLARCSSHCGLLCQSFVTRPVRFTMIGCVPWCALPCWICERLIPPPPLQAYPATSVFLVLYDVQSAASFTSVVTKWLPETAHHCPSALHVLVAAKEDLRSSASVPLAAGDELVHKGRVHAHFLTSAITGAGPRSVIVFQT